MEAGAAQMTSQVYRFRYADPQAAYTVLQALVPSAKMAIDAKEGSLVASSLPEDHLKIKATIDQMDGEDAEGQRPALKVHRVTVGSVANVYRSLALLFREDATVQLSLDLDNDAVIAVASAGKQERIAELIKSIEDAARQDAQATLELYSLRNVDAASAQEILKQMLDKQGSKADISFDEISNQLVAIARPEVHEQIAKLLEQLRGPEPELEIYDLKYVDPDFRRNGDPAPIRRRRTIAGSEHRSGHPTAVHPGHGRTAAEDPRPADQDGRDRLGAAPRPQQPEHAHRSLSKAMPRPRLEEIRRIWPKLRDNEIRVRLARQPLPPQATGEIPPAKETRPQQVLVPSQSRPPPFASRSPAFQSVPFAVRRNAGRQTRRRARPAS